VSYRLHDLAVKLAANVPGLVGEPFVHQWTLFERILNEELKGVSSEDEFRSRYLNEWGPSLPHDNIPARPFMRKCKHDHVIGNNRTCTRCETGQK
jgi:hypothetical protein